MFADIGTAYGHPYYYFVIGGEDVIERRLSVGEQRPSRDGYAPGSLQPLGPAGKVGRAEDKVGRANFVDNLEIAFAEFFHEPPEDRLIFVRRHCSSPRTVSGRLLPA